MSNVGSALWPARATVNEAMAKMAKDDPFTEMVETQDVPYDVDQIHFNAVGMIELGKRMHAAWKTAMAKTADATKTSGLKTLGELIVYVRRIYERYGASNATTAELVTECLNEAINEIALTLGSNAWFWRRVVPVTLDGVYPNTVTLPLEVNRFLMLTSATFPGRKIVTRGLAYTDQGRVQLTIHDSGEASYLCHFMDVPKPLAGNNDRLLLPEQYLPLLRSITCVKLASVTGNMEALDYYRQQAAEMWQWVKRDVQRYAQMRESQLTTGGGYDAWRDGADPDLLGRL